jgi:small ligand-binding sensory domain FIST
MMFFVSASTTESESEAAATSHFAAPARQLITHLRALLNPRVMLGCSAEGVIGQDQEYEDAPAVTLIAASLPGVRISPFMLLPDQMDLPSPARSPRLMSGQADWHKLLLDAEEFRRVVDAPEDTQLFILLGDPFSTPMDDVLQAFNTCFPGVPVVGGMASGALRPYGNALWIDDQLAHEGAVGLSLAGELAVDVVVSQGCRPIWRPFTVVEAHRNVIYNLEGRAPLAWLQDLIPQLSEEDRHLLQKGLFVGRSIKVGGENLGRGDFLLRGVIGIDQNNGAIAVGDSIMDGETIQFHLRDALTAKEDLEMMLIPQAFRPPPSGALLFSCNGRGTRLYDHPNGDIDIVQANLEGAHLAGFFCAGEIGPIGGVNFLHGHTASLAIFRPSSTR